MLFTLCCRCRQIPTQRYGLQRATGLRDRERSPRSVARQASVVGVASVARSLSLPLDLSDDFAAFEERAAVCEYDGGVPIHRPSCWPRAVPCRSRRAKPRRVDRRSSFISAITLTARGRTSRGLPDVGLNRRAGRS